MDHKLKQITLPEFLLWVFQQRRRFRVIGNSMLPLLNPGDEVLINPTAYQYTAPHLGDIVVAQHPLWSNLRLIKRVTGVAENNHYLLEGDNPAESTDSRMFGPVATKNILGQVTCRFS